MNTSGDKKTVIGLTGKYCAGKNRAAALLEKRGIPVLDVDKLGHAALEEQKAAVSARFGKEILREDGTIDRRILGAKVFDDAGELAALEAIVHPAANRMTCDWIRAQKGKLCVINAALLHRSSAFSELAAVIVVEAPLLTRLIRAKRRDHLPWLHIFRRFSSQKNFSSQIFRTDADIYTVENRGIFSGRAAEADRKLERRLDEILHTLG